MDEALTHSSSSIKAFLTEIKIPESFGRLHLATLKCRKDDMNNKMQFIITTNKAAHPKNLELCNNQ